MFLQVSFGTVAGGGGRFSRFVFDILNICRYIDSRCFLFWIIRYAYAYAWLFSFLDAYMFDL